jgi:hypothetical protein
VRVRTYGFPGSFTRPPGTSTRNHHHEPTTSKPVVPWDVLLVQCSRAHRRAADAEEGGSDVYNGRARHAEGIKTTRSRAA